MSTTTTPLDAGTPGPSGPDFKTPRRRRRVLAGAGTLLLLVAAGVVIVATDPFGRPGQAQAGVTDNTYPTSLATVRQGPLSSQVTDSGTLGYAAQADGSPYDVVNQATGAFTSLPAVGQVIRQGQVLYRVADDPVVLLDGSTPAYRSLSDGDTGPDVQELNADLVSLGYATSSELDRSSDYFGAETEFALERLQRALGESETGTLDLGQAVFLPGPLRISQVTATLGTTAPPGAVVAQATSSVRQVEVDLDASEQTSVSVGDQALVTLPDNQTTPGVVTGTGTVATSSGGGASGSSGATIPIYITLKHPQAAGDLDQAPVQVQITTAGVKNALIVPVDALLALAGGGYAVETVDARGVHQLVPVTLGLFDDADGLVQVTGSLSPGERVVVPSI